MATKTKNWSSGTGSATIQYGGQGDGEIIVTTDPNNLYEARSMQIVVETTDGSGIQRVVTVNQAAKQRIDLSAAVVTATTQTYSGSAKTPTPTVTLNGSTVPSSGYDVSYSNNTNAGTATITITGKGDYTGTASGTFTINKATPSYAAPATRSLTYNGSSQYLTTSGSTSHGTIYYSTDGVNWYTSRRTATTAGSYSCYWKLVGDSNHTDISSTYLGHTTIAKASRSMSWNSYPSSLYVGSNGTLSATASAGGSDGTISYSSSNSSRARVSGSTVTGVSVGTCTIYASISEGTNYLSASTSYTLTVQNEWDNVGTFYSSSYFVWETNLIGLASIQRSSLPVLPGTYRIKVTVTNGMTPSYAQSLYYDENLGRDTGNTEISVGTWNTITLPASCMTLKIQVWADNVEGNTHPHFTVELQKRN